MKIIRASIDTSAEHIKAEIFDYLAENFLILDSDMYIDQALTDIKKLAPRYTVEDVRNLADNEGMSLEDAIVELKSRM